MTQPQTPLRRFWLGGKRAAEQDRFFREALEARGWQQGDETQWDAGWITGMPDPAQFRHAAPRRKLNHFPGNAALTVKSRLHDSLGAMRERVHEAWGPDSEAAERLAFFPRAYLMPRDYHALQAAAVARPEQRWILKPTNASKGKGIRVLGDVAAAPLARDWLVQEYLANPHTIRGHKYVLRLYVLISSLTPLRVYLYRQGFAKLASEPWDPDDADNPFSQLTNPDINALNDSAEVPVEFIDLERYRAWLRDQGHDDAALFARIEDLVALTAISAVDAMRLRTAEAGADPRGCYELLGLDCLVDDTLKPWILECNLSPSLGTCAAPESGGRVEEAIKGALVNDLVRLVDVPGEAPTPSDEVGAVSLLAEAEAEQARAGDFRLLLPASTPERYLPFFSLPDLSDFRLAEALAGYALPRPTLERREVVELFHGDELALHDLKRGHYYRPNDSAALIWLLATEGFDPDAIAEQLDDALSGNATGDADAHRELVWRTLHGWCRDGLLRQRGAAPQQASRETSSPPFRRELRLAFDGHHWALSVGSAAAMARLDAAFAGRLGPLRDDEAGRLPWLSILCEPGGGYALASDQALVASRLPLARLADVLCGELLRQAALPDQAVIDAPLVLTAEGGGWLCLGTPDEAAIDGVSGRAGRVCRGLRLSLADPSRAEPLGLPLAGASSPAGDWPGGVAINGVLLPDGEGAWGSTTSTLEALGSLLPRVITPRDDPLDEQGVQALATWLADLAAGVAGACRFEPAAADG